jgi:hypothetical protein
MDVRPPRPNASEATSQEIRQVFEGLAGKVRESKLQPGDTVFLVIESHVLNFGSREGSLLLGADAQPKQLEQTCISGAAIAESLKYLTERGCLVLLFLDGIHEPVRGLPVEPRRDLVDWVRKLRDDCGVIVLLASKQDASQRLRSKGLSVFAQAILDSITVAGGAGPETSPSLEDFQARVLKGVEELSGRSQFAGFYPPEHLNPRVIRIFEPQARPVASVAGNLPQPDRRRVNDSQTPRPAGVPR